MKIYHTSLTSKKIYHNSAVIIIMALFAVLSLFCNGGGDSTNGDTDGVSTATGSLDTTFDPGTGANSGINAIALQGDGKIVIAGGFTSYDGTARNRIARLSTDGSLDTTFDPGDGADNYIQTIALQSDGKIIICGEFANYDGTGRTRIARVNTDGSLDTSFDPGTSANNYVVAIAIQSDGKILIGGSFTSYDGTARNRIARVNTDGSLDTTFDPGDGADSYLYSIALQSDGKMIIVGNFTSYDGTARNRIARVDTDGTLDTDFDPGTGASDCITAMALQSDGKIVIGGDFLSYAGTNRRCIARVNADGSLDTAFDPGIFGVNNASKAMVQQSDGKIVIGGYFTSYADTDRNYIARINTDGSLDTSFDPGTGATSTIMAMALQSDGKIIIGGFFTSYNGTARNYIARVK